jgi:hypothetical protein
MTWKPITAEERETIRQVLLWIRTVRDTGIKYGLVQYPSDWLPSDIDCAKSALLERIRNGLTPMDEPPPVAYSCPWYALVEDEGPHYIFDVHQSGQFLAQGQIAVAQNVFMIYERKSDTDLIVGDSRGTSYRFRLWYDPDWYNRGSTLPIENRPRGGWFLQNLAFASVIETRSAKTGGLGPQDESAVAKPDAQGGPA